MTIRFLTSGESHGKCLNAIIEGIGYGYELDFDFINNELKNRQQGKGRGGRMKIETDKIEIKSGVRFNKTTGSPICIEINNRDFANWQIPMSISKFDFEKLNEDEKNEIIQKIEEKKITRVRPGHADLAGAIKFGADDIRDILERSSARETATRVAVGAICQNILQKFGIFGSCEVVSICNETNENKIDEINILQATKLGLTNSIKELKVTPDLILVDALKGIDTCNIPYQSIIKGDALCYSIAAASIIAKVTRDRIMKGYDKVYPEYGFATHKGYGTAKHIEAIKEYGICPIHRRSFLKNLI